MEIYEVDGDGDFLWLYSTHDPDTSDIWNFGTYNTLWASDRPLPVAETPTFDSVPWLAADLAYFQAQPVLCMSDHALDALSPLLAGLGKSVDSGMVLGTHYSTFFPEARFDAIDLKRSEIDYYNSGNVEHIRRFALDLGVIGGAPVFRLVHRRGHVYATDVFKKVVEDHRLVGFAFTKVWSSDAVVTVAPPDFKLELPKARRARRLAKRAQAEKVLLERQSERPSSIS